MGNENSVYKNDPSFAIPFCAKDRNGRDMFRMFVCGARGVSFNYEPCTKRLQVECGSNNPDLDIINNLITSGWDVNDQEQYDDCGKTALIEAAVHENIDVMKLLVENHNASVDFLDNFNQTALMWAVVCEHENCIRYLLSKGANPNLKNSDGYYPIHLVLEESDNVTSLKHLHKHGADLNLLDADGDSCAHYCAKYNSLESLAYIIDAEASLDIKNYSGESARSIAVRLQHDEIVEMIDDDIDRRSSVASTKTTQEPKENKEDESETLEVPDDRNKLEQGETAGLTTKENEKGGEAKIDETDEKLEVTKEEGVEVEQEEVEKEEANQVEADYSKEVTPKETEKGEVEAGEQN